MNLPTLIAVVFIKNDDPLNKTEVNHLDLNPLNNAIDNLEWCTKEHNMKYSTVFHALEKALPNIDCHEGISTCREITDKVVENGEDKTTLVAMAAVEINNKHLAAAS